MRKLLIVLLPLVLLIPQRASPQVHGTRTAVFVYRYNLTTTTLTYCKVTGAGGNPFGGPQAGQARISTVGSSTTVSAQTTGQGPFTPVNVGDVIEVRRGVQAPPALLPDLRVVIAKASADSITIDTAVDWSTSTVGFEFRFYQTVCGTTATDGWIEAAGYQAKILYFSIQAQSALVGGINVRWECKSQGIGSQPTIFHPGTTGVCTPGTSSGGFCNFTTTGGANFALAIPTDVPCSQVRMGFAVGTSATSTALNAQIDEVAP